MEEIKIPCEQDFLFGNLTIPKCAKGIVLFAHGSGSSRFSKRNALLANMFQEKLFATLLFDLLTEDEEKIDLITREHRFNIPLIGKRVVEVSLWLKKEKRTKDLPLSLIGSSTGAAAALLAAATLKNEVTAIVSRGGRPDLAYNELKKVTAPTLLIVGSEDSVVIELNEKALDLLNCEKKLVLVEGATHLFEEPGTLEQAAKLSILWIEKHLT